MAHDQYRESRDYIAALNAALDGLDEPNTTRIPDAEWCYTGGGCSCIYVSHPEGGGVIIADALGPDDGPGDYAIDTAEVREEMRPHLGAVSLAAVLEEDWCDPIMYINVPGGRDDWADPAAVAKAVTIAWRAIETRRPVGTPRPDEAGAYRYAVGVDSAWNAADIHDDPADAIAHAIAAAAERAARGEDDCYPVAVYLLPRNA